MYKLIATAALIAGFTISAAQADVIEVLPASYSFSRATDSSAYNYADESGQQLIDGSYGSKQWWANSAYEWLGWFSTDPAAILTIDFDFNQAALINQIKIGSVQNNIGDIVLPSIEIFSSSDRMNWVSQGAIATPEDAANDDSYRTFSFNNLDLNTQYIRLALTQPAVAPWIFLDEVDFYRNQAAQVPAPGLFWLIAAGLMALGFNRRSAKA